MKVILKICVVKFRKSTPPQGLTLSPNTTGGQTPKFCRNRAENSVFHNFHPLKYAEYPLKPILNILVYYTNEMDQVIVPVGYICVHPGGSNSPILTKNDTRYFVV